MLDMGSGSGLSWMPTAEMCPKPYGSLLLKRSSKAAGRYQIQIHPEPSDETQKCSKATGKTGESPIQRWGNANDEVAAALRTCVLVNEVIPERFKKHLASATPAESAPPTSVSAPTVPGSYPKFQFLEETGTGLKVNLPTPGVAVAKRIPKIVVAWEEEWHRHAAHYVAAGYPIVQIAGECGQEVEAVRQLLRKPEFINEVMAIASRHGFDCDIMAQFQNEVAASLQTLVELRDDPETPKAVRAKICVDIIERVLGKALQRYEVTQKGPASPVERYKQLEEHNRQMREQLALSDKWDSDDKL